MITSKYTTPKRKMNTTNINKFRDLPFEIKLRILSKFKKTKNLKEILDDIHNITCLGTNSDVKKILRNFINKLTTKIETLVDMMGGNRYYIVGDYMPDEVLDYVIYWKDTFSINSVEDYNILIKRLFYTYCFLFHYFINRRIYELFFKLTHNFIRIEPRNSDLFVILDYILSATGYEKQRFDALIIKTNNCLTCAVNLHDNIYYLDKTTRIALKTNKSWPIITSELGRKIVYNDIHDITAEKRLNDLLEIALPEDLRNEVIDSRTFLKHKLKTVYNYRLGCIEFRNKISKRIQEYNTENFLLDEQATQIQNGLRNYDNEYLIEEDSRFYETYIK